MLVHRPLADEEEKREAELLLARCDSLEGLDLPVAIPHTGALPDGGIAPFLWLEAGEIRGFLALEGWPIPEGTPLVHPQHRLRGIGRALVEAATSACRDCGLRRWHIVCDSVSEGSIRFAERLGARFDSAEYRMVLDRQALPPRPESPPGVRLEQVHPEETEEFARTLARAFDDPLDQVRPWSREQAESRNIRLFIARHDEKPVGTLRLISIGFDAYVTALGVLREHRRQGLGRWMVLSAVHDLIDEGWQRILIEVDTTNDAAYRLYRECGFRETRTYRAYEVKTGL
jgi:ribosomal protein S18 acetylase RimI-like enzyme